MKRYFTFIGMIVFIGLFLAVGVYIQQERQQQLATQEMYAKERHLVVYSDMPTAVNRDLAAAFYKSKHLRVQMVSMSEDGLQRALQKPVQGRMTPDVVIASEDTLRQGQIQGCFIPYSSEATETVPLYLKDDENAWTGLWYDPLLFVVNRDYYAMGGNNINTWSDLLTDSTISISFPDLAATDIGGDFLCEFVEVHGSERSALYFRSLQERIGTYSKTMAPVMHRVASGEVQVGIIDALTERQYRFDGAPVFDVYPQDGTSYWLTGTAVTRWCEDEELAAVFTDWLLSNEAVDILSKNRLYYNFASSTLPQRQDSKGKDPVLFMTTKHYNDEQRKELQDWWIRTVRFGKDT